MRSYKTSEVQLLRTWDGLIGDLTTCLPKTVGGERDVQRVDERDD